MEGFHREASEHEGIQVIISECIILIQFKIYLFVSEVPVPYGLHVQVKAFILNHINPAYCSDLQALHKNQFSHDQVHYPCFNKIKSILTAISK